MKIAEGVWFELHMVSGKEIVFRPLPKTYNAAQVAAVISSAEDGRVFPEALRVELLLALARELAEFPHTVIPAEFLRPSEFTSMSKGPVLFASAQVVSARVIVEDRARAIIEDHTLKLLTKEVPLDRQNSNE